ncbi:alpha/beta family hydrolase [Terrarubrum flagellatum]|uniref:alpha/beta family hydrolase n=1 Tax=Terrirubrum flagellatum TaxID=2895980 RepID=UPI0031453F3C
MNAASAALAAVGMRIAPFEFDYTAERRNSGTRKPRRAETLRHEYIDAIDALAANGSLIIGGKFMGGRVASMAADRLAFVEPHDRTVGRGLSVHPPGKSDQLGTKHFEDLKTPTLVVSGHMAVVNYALPNCRGRE